MPYRFLSIAIGNIGPLSSPCVPINVHDEVLLVEDDDSAARPRALAAKRGRHRLQTATPSPVGSASLTSELWRVYRHTYTQ